MSIRLNDAELEALRGLTDFQFRLYVSALRPRMDYRSGLAGRKTRLSYQAIVEATEEWPTPGAKTRPRPSKDQIYRALRSLERRGLIKVVSADRELVVRFVFADFDAAGNSSVSGKAATRPRQGRDESRDDRTRQNPSADGGLSGQQEDRPRQAFEEVALQAATPPESGKTKEGGGVRAHAREGVPPADPATFAALRTELGGHGWPLHKVLSADFAVTLRHWCAKGVTARDVAAAVEEARACLGGELPGSPAYLRPIMARVIRAKENPEGVVTTDPGSSNAGGDQYETRRAVRPAGRGGSRVDRVLGQCYAGAFRPGHVDDDTVI
ncbi:MAG: hypothetical protein R3310_12540 [Candidatus Competibacteraceae bacterium]|nr:hypothetical protein [Candidatus Competibacteraceae bacterium]